MPEYTKVNIISANEQDNSRHTKSDDKQLFTNKIVLTINKIVLRNMSIRSKLCLR